MTIDSSHLSADSFFNLQTIGLDIAMMMSYIDFTADHLFAMLNLPKIYDMANPVSLR
jgi:hypothetical protein